MLGKHTKKSRPDGRLLGFLNPIQKYRWYVRQGKNGVSIGFCYKTWCLIKTLPKANLMHNYVLAFATLPYTFNIQRKK
jgi:hypothetical protein